VQPQSYNYSPAVMDDGDVIKAWWCSASSLPGQATDQIWYQEYNKTTKQYSNRRSILQTGKPGDWDTFGVCHPSVIKGEWPGAPGGGNFTYAMYYTSTNVAQGGGSNNSTGVIFSTDGINWVGQHDKRNPVIKQKVPNVPGTYGAGLPAAWSNGGSSVTVFWSDTTWEKSTDPSIPGYRSHSVYATAPDGIHFSKPTLVAPTGVPGYWKNDFAFDQATPAQVYSAQAGTFRKGAPDEKSETYNFGIYKIAKDPMLAGTGTWSTLGVVDTNLTGLPLNFEPGLVRTPTGAIAGDPAKEGITVWFGGGSGLPTTWQLHKVTLMPNQSKATVFRYSDGAGAYWTTSGYAPASFKAKAKAVVDLPAHASEANQYGVYSCLKGPMATDAEGHLTGQGAVEYVSMDMTCGGDTVLGVNGYASIDPSPGATVLYACKDGAAPFVSTDAKCEGKTVDKPLGYVAAG
ncbi:MAG TPA: hypothetical protein VFJ85_16270, partial [Acidimicrobiales bacterium]|nr:hypothetical protein [Acidimicrobiales bacterium]